MKCSPDQSGLALRGSDAATALWQDLRGWIVNTHLLIGSTEIAAYHIPHPEPCLAMPVGRRGRRAVFVIEHAPALLDVDHRGEACSPVETLAATSNFTLYAAAIY